MGRLHMDTGWTVVGPAPVVCQLGSRNVDMAVLGMVHEGHSSWQAVGNNGPGDDDSVAVEALDPIVVLNSRFLGVIFVQPDGRSAAEECEHRLGIEEHAVD